MVGARGRVALGAALMIGACSGHGAPGPVPTGRDTVFVSGNDRVPLERRFAVRLSPPDPATLRCTAPAEPLEDHRLDLDDGEGELRLYGLLPATRYACELVDDGGRVRWTGGFSTDPLPDGIPTLNPSGDRAAATVDDGYVLVAHWPLGRDAPDVKRLIVYDGEGRVRWFLAIDDARTGGLAGAVLAPGAEVLPGGRLVTGGGQSSPPAIRNLSGEVLYQVPPAVEQDPGYHHEALLSPEGWVVSLQSVDNVGPAGEAFDGFRIEAWDPLTDQLQWSFDTQPYVDSGLLPPGGEGDMDPFHANAVAFVDDDPEGPAVWVSLRGLRTLMRIDRASREVTGFFGPERGIGLRLPDGSPAAEADWFWGQHAPEFAGDVVLVYDNGGSRPGPRQFSRVAAYRRLGPDEAQLLWDWTEPGWYELNFGSIVTVPDSGGHVLVGTGHCGECDPPGDVAWALELDPASGNVVWRLDLPSDRHSLYRAQPVRGCDLFANLRYCPVPPPPAE